MTNIQLYLAIGIPLLGNAVLIGVLMAYINAKFDAVNNRFEAVDRRFEGTNQRFEGINQRFEGINQRFEDMNKSMNQRFDAIDRRFDDMRDLWRAELRRVEEVLDARLKHLEER